MLNFDVTNVWLEKASARYSLKLSVARYEEAYPLVFTIITFPFLFAVTFGDWGHRFCLLAGALILIARESNLSSQEQTHDRLSAILLSKWPDSSKVHANLNEVQKSLITASVLGNF